MCFQAMMRNASDVKSTAKQFKAVVGTGNKVALPADIVIIASVLEIICKRVSVNEDVSILPDCFGYTLSIYESHKHSTLVVMDDKTIIYKVRLNTVGHLHTARTKPLLNH